MSALIEASIIEKLHRLTEFRQAEVLDFVEYLASKSNSSLLVSDGSKIIPSHDPKTIGAKQEFNPMRYSGTVQWPVDGLAYQEAVRREWE